MIKPHLRVFPKIEDAQEYELSWPGHPLLTARFRISGTTSPNNELLAKELRFWIEKYTPDVVYDISVVGKQVQKPMDIPSFTEWRT